MQQPMTPIDLTTEIELLRYTLECVAQTEPCDYTEAAASLLAGQIRQHAWGKFD
jgi:hypothetical protein